jgi:CHAD domain-containing protein
MTPPTQSCTETFQSIADSCLQAFDRSLTIFLETDEPEGPHKTRVALRRLTTCLDAFGPILRRKVTRDLRDEAKRLFRALGKVRDSDVYLAGRVDAPGHDKRLRENLALRDKTRAQLRKAKAVCFSTRVASYIQPGGAIFRDTRHSADLARAPVDKLVQEVLDQAWEACLDFGPSVTAIARKDRHEFRKDMKRMRYLAEFFTDVVIALGQEPFKRDFRSLQDALGVLNDYEVALKLEKRKPTKQLPDPQASALAEADRLWAGLACTSPPWRG